MVIHNGMEVVVDSSHEVRVKTKYMQSKSKVGKRWIKVVISKEKIYLMPDTMSFVYKNKLFVNPNVYNKLKVGICK